MSDSRREKSRVADGLARAPRVSRERFRREVFRDDWESMSDAERTERLRSIMPPGYLAAGGPDMTAEPER